MEFVFLFFFDLSFDFFSRGVMMPAAWSLGAPTCSRRGGLEEQEVKVFSQREEAEQAGGRGGAGGTSLFPGAQASDDWALEEGP